MGMSQRWDPDLTELNVGANVLTLGFSSKDQGLSCFAAYSCSTLDKALFSSEPQFPCVAGNGADCPGEQ